MFESICSYPLPSELFTQAIHPSEPLISVGLASGHVQVFRLPQLPSPTTPDDDPPDPDTSALSNGCGTVDTLWRTRRHKGSCRSVAFSSDGEKLFSAGTDGLVKMAATQTGQVESKVLIPPASMSSLPDTPSLLHPLTPTTLLLATDSAALHIYDLRTSKSTSPSIPSNPSQTHHPHEDYISSLTPLPASATSPTGTPTQFATTGSTTLAVTDLRRGILVKSADQEEELLSSVYISGLPKTRTNSGEKLLVGGDGGVLTLWEKGVWDDQDERVYVGEGESVDVLCAMPEGIGGGRSLVAAGLGDGKVRFVRVGGGGNGVLGEVVHDELEGVVGLGFDVEGRMVSGGGGVVKVWQERWSDYGEVEEDGKRGMGSDGDSEKDEDEDESSEEERREKRRKKKKRKKNGRKERGGEKENGISFSGLD